MKRNSDEYLEALEAAKGILAENFSSEWYQNYSRNLMLRAAGTVDRLWEYVQAGVYPTIDGLVSIESMPEKEREHLRRHPAVPRYDDGATYDHEMAARLLVAYKLQNGLPLEGPLLDWLIFFLAEREPLPRPKGRPKKKHNEPIITGCIEFLCKEFKIKPTRNQISETVSACDIVAEAMLSLDRRPSSYHSIEEIWKGWPRIIVGD